MFVVFSERLKIEAMFKRWCKELGASPSPMNMITFLEINSLLNEEKVKEFLKELKKVDI